MKTTYLQKGVAAAILIFIASLNSLFAQTALKASFNLTDSIGCAPLRVNFKNTSKGAVSYRWYFGSVNSSTLTHPSIVFNALGNYSITLVAFDANGGTDTFTRVAGVSVINGPEAAFTAVKRSACLGAPIAFSNTSLNATSYIWDFGDGSTSYDKNPSHTWSSPGVYTIKLIAINAYGCKSSYSETDYINVFPPLSADFSADLTNICDSTQEILFTASSAGATSYLWDFGNGRTASGKQVKFKYNTEGEYTVGLTVTSSQGCVTKSVKKNYITVKNAASYQVVASMLNPCEGVPVSFSVPNLEDVKSIVWYFGDGDSSTLLNPTHSYKKGGSFTPYVKWQSISGCVGKLTGSAIKVAPGKATADFTGGGKGCVPLTVDFTDASSNAVNYLWDFGDGTTSTLKNPSHTYTTPGEYNVSLVVTTSTGCQVSVIKNKVVKAEKLPVSMFSLDKAKGCPPLQVSFKANSADIAAYMWDFGDGQTATLANPKHIFSRAGDYHVKLRVISKSGCADTSYADTIISVKDIIPGYKAPAPLIGCAPFTTSFTDAMANAARWHWDFGDGTSSDLQKPFHTFTKAGEYKVKLTIVTSDSCVVEFPLYQKVIVNKIEAKMATRVSKCPPFILNAYDSSGVEGNYFWDFGDGTASTLRNPAHTYQKPGDYLVRFTVMNGEGCVATDSMVVHFNPFGASPKNSKADSTFPQNMTFTANGRNVDSYEWDFGDGSPVSNDSIVTHKYLTEGKYTITLKIRNKDCEQTFTLKPFLPQLPPSPVAIDTTIKKEGISTNTEGGCLPLYVQFQVKTRKAVSSRLWDFGDGKTSRAAAPLHAYTKLGQFKARVYVTYQGGGIDTFFYTVTATKPVAAFVMQQTTGKKGTTVKFIDKSNEPKRWTWNFGDGGYSDEQNPEHTFPDSGGHYTISLTVNDMGGCEHQSSQIIDTKMLTNSILFGSNKACVGFAVNVSHKLDHFKKYVWDFGDGSTSLLQRPSHIYSKPGAYMISLTLYDNNGNIFTYLAPDSVRVYQPQASFTVSKVLEGCDSVTVLFTNTSVGADKYRWIFGDGKVATTFDAKYTYTKKGEFSAMLVATYAQCSDTFRLQRSIIVHKATADFVASHKESCYPVTVEFKDASVNAVKWFWDFGDGTTSTLQNPQHVYTSKAARFPTLTITDINGCTAKVQKEAVKTVKAQFTLSATSGCGGKDVFKIQNNSRAADTYFWDFGDGTTSTLKNPTKVYANSGTYWVRLIVVNNEGCSDSMTFPKPVVITRPVSHFYSLNAATCAPSLVDFKDSSRNAVKYFWDFGDGVTSKLSNPSHIYNVPGRYTVRLVVQNENGCTDTMIRKDYVTVLGPVSKFNMSDTISCEGKAVYFVDQSIDAVKWEWSFGDGTGSSEQHPQHTYANAGTYVVTLITYDVNGCKNAFTLYPGIYIRPKKAPAINPLWRVSVVAETVVGINWEKNTDPNFYAYELYHKAENESEYMLIATITDRNILYYDDNGIFPNLYSYSYKVRPVDICGFGKPLSECLPHSTINTSAITAGNSVTVNWNPYGGAGVDSYYVYKSVNFGTSTFFTKVPGTVTSINDGTNLCAELISYKVLAKGANGKLLDSWSDTCIAMPENAFANQRTNITRSTVEDNRFVLTEWTKPDTLASLVISYIIERSVGDRQHWEVVGNVPADQFYYLDDEVDVQNNTYHYRISAQNSCKSKSARGEQGHNIVLRGHNESKVMKLEWEDYTDWLEGVDYFIIEEQDNNGKWIFRNQVPSAVRSIIMEK